MDSKNNDGGKLRLARAPHLVQTRYAISFSCWHAEQIMPAHSSQSPFYRPETDKALGSRYDLKYTLMGYPIREFPIGKLNRTSNRIR
jgi:hypothetical protein